MKPLSILYLEDNPIDVELIQSRLEAEGISHRLTHCGTAKQFIHALKARPYDIVLLDYSVPGFDRLSALKMAREQLPDIPVIIISGVIGEEIAIETLKQGAVDYVLKQRISRLAPAIRRALQEAEERQKRNAAENALKASEERYRTIFSNTGTATVIIDDRTVICLANDEFKKLAGAASKAVEGKSRLIDFADGAEQRKLSSFLADHLKKRSSAAGRSEFLFTDAKGSRRNFIVTISGIPETSRSVVSLLDYTELKTAEDRIQKDLKEKEVLLKEIHHRVKNNLQIMCSLLHLQSASIADDTFRKRCEGCRNRIYTMSLVHEHLYVSSNLSSIHFRDTASSLVNKLLHSQAVRGRVTVQLEMENVFLPIGLSIPLALILNELAANALKHAFPDGRKGQIRLQLRPTARNSCELSVIDDGIGLPNSIDMQNSSGFGLHLVGMLVQQVNGSIAVTRKKGTTFKIQFPLESI